MEYGKWHCEKQIATQKSLLQICHVCTQTHFFHVESEREERMQ